MIDAKGRCRAEYKYDKKGNRIEIKDALDRKVQKEYDKQGRLRK